MAGTVFTTAENNTWAHTLPGKMTSACVALVAPGNHVLMVKASYKNEWTFPSGVVDIGESPAQLPLTALAIPNDEITAAEWVPFPQVAQKAGGRASYHILQARLTGELQDMYNEILPMRRSGTFTEDAISH